MNTTNGNTVLGGTSEGGSIAQTVKPTLEEIEVLPKTAQLSFSASEVMEWLATNSKDDIWGGLGAMRLFMAVQHKELLNRMLGADVEKEAADASGNASAIKDFECLDRIVSSSAEEAVTGGSNTGYYDAWTKVDRDSSTAHDSTVESASGTLGTNGVLTDDVVRTFLRKIRVAAGKDPAVFIGSHEVYSEIQGLYTPSVRYSPLGEAMVQVDVNGIQTFKGIGVGIHVDSIYGIPFIPSKDSPSNADDSAEISLFIPYL